MAINLNEPLAWTRANADERAMLDDLQGNILKGHGRGDTASVFLRFDRQKPDDAKSFIRVISTSVTSAGKQFADSAAYRRESESGGLFVAFFLSAAGYRALGVPEQGIAKDPAFRAGMKGRRAKLNDPPTSRWDPHFQEEIHAMLLLGDDTAALVQTAKTGLLARAPVSIKVLGEEIGRAMKSLRSQGEGIEHFGYVDGRSQPLLLAEDIEHERDRTDGISVWNPAFPLKQVLEPCAGKGATSFGSYLVFRKLEQNVRGFKKA